MSCRFKHSDDKCSLCSATTSPYCVERDGSKCSIYSTEKELEDLKLVLSKTREDLSKERSIKAEIFNTLFSIHEVYILKKKDQYYISLVINGEIYSWEVDEESIVEGAYQAIPLRKRRIWTSHL